MRRAFRTSTVIALALAFVHLHAGAASNAAIAIDAARVTLAGTSNVHEYTAASTTVRVTKAQLAAPAADADFWDSALKPGALEAFAIAIPATSLKSDKDGLDKNMYKALKAAEHPDITFKLARFESIDGRTFAMGTLGIAGVEREVAIDLTTARRGDALVVKGAIDLLMTDYGIAPPKAMMGMLKTNPKVTVRFEVTLAVALT